MTEKSKKLDLNPEFLQALELLEKGEKHVFVTGKAGTGKSTFLAYFREHTKRNIVVLAPTGVAALNVNGETIHSFFGFLPGITVEDIEPNERKSKKFMKLDTIVIDEVSMVRADLLDCVDRALRLWRGREEVPFWGVKMIFVGDLYQLPPVVTSAEKEAFKTLYTGEYFFCSHVMGDPTFSMEYIEFTHVYRQEDDRFIDILNHIRNRSITNMDLKHLNARVDPDYTISEHDQRLWLVTTNDRADSINETELAKLSGAELVSEAEIDGDFKKQDYPTEVDLRLRVGAQIMFLTNDPGGQWVNGTIGTILEINADAPLEEPSFVAETEEGKRVKVSLFTWEKSKFEFDRAFRRFVATPVGSFRQFPVRLSWAVTIHKSQGKTFERVAIDFGRGTFAHGQAYVALSRCRSLEGIVMTRPFRLADIRLDWRVKNFITRYQYGISEKNMSLEDKISFLRVAIKEKKKVRIVYLKGTDERSERIVMPKKVSLMEYKDKEYMGLLAHCNLRNEERVFNVEKMLKIDESMGMP